MRGGARFYKTGFEQTHILYQFELVISLDVSTTTNIQFIAYYAILSLISFKFKSYLDLEGVFEKIATSIFLIQHVQITLESHFAKNTQLVPQKLVF